MNLTPLVHEEWTLTMRRGINSPADRDSNSISPGNQFPANKLSPISED